MPCRGRVEPDGGKEDRTAPDRLACYASIRRTPSWVRVTGARTEGLVTSEHGRGVFVRAAPVVRRLASERFARQHCDRGKAAFLAEAEKVGYAPGVDSIRVHEEPAPADPAERLKIETGSPVIVRDRRYLANGEPVEIATSYIPVDLARGTAIVENDTGPGGIYARLEESGHPLDRFVEEVAARMPTPAARRSWRRTGPRAVRTGPVDSPRSHRLPPVRHRHSNPTASPFALVRTLLRRVGRVRPWRPRGRGGPCAGSSRSPTSGSRR